MNLLSLISSIFADTAYMEEILFSKDVDFKNAQFYGSAGFWAANFDRRVRFSRNEIL